MSKTKRIPALIVLTWCLFSLLGSGAAQPSDGSGGPEAAGTNLGRALADRNFAAVEEAIKPIKTPRDIKAAVVVLKGKLKDEDVRVRRLAAYALSEIDREEAKQAVAALVEALRDDEPRVRARVALSLGQIGPVARDAVAALAGLLRDPDPRARGGAARALGAIGEDAKSTIPALAELLKDQEPPVRILAAMALGQFGSLAKSATPALKTAQAADGDARVRATAGAALDEIDPSLALVIDALSAPQPGRRLWAVSILTEKGPKAAAAAATLIETLQHDESPAVRAGAAFALGKIGAEARLACPALAEALKDRESRVRTAAALGLGLLGHEGRGSALALAATLQDERDEVAGAVATALGNLGADAEAAAPRLIELAKHGNLVWRRRGVNVLARIGPAAASAAPVLVEILKDSDPALRHDAVRALVSLGPQPSAPMPALLEALGCGDADAGRLVRAWACLSLGAMGPAAAPAISPLIKTLGDDAERVRSAAADALGRIGPMAIPALLKALRDANPQVRRGAARALDHLGLQARRALPGLCEALQDDDAGVLASVCDAIAKIATGLQLMQETDALADLEPTLKALGNAQKNSIGSAEETHFTACVDRVRDTIASLHAVQRGQVFEHIVHSAWFPWLAGATLYFGGLLSAWLTLLWLCPLALLRINESLRRFPHIHLPGGLEMSLRGLLLVGLFHYHRRVLDAWIGGRLQAFRECYDARRTVKDRAVYIPMPVILDGQVAPGLTAAQLRQAFERKRGCLLIWGEGGAGKTTLACQAGRWALAPAQAERLCEHVMLPVLIEHELDLTVAEGKPAFTALTEAVRGQLQALIGDATSLPQELVEHLLRQRRILVIVDHLSEITPAARAAIRPGHPDFPANALIVTSRCEEVLDGVPKNVIQPLRIAGNRLSSFMEAYLLQRGKRQLFDDAEYFEACRRLSLLVGARDITPLLAKLYAEQMIAHKESWPQGSLPTSLPDLILGYLNELNRAVSQEQRRGDFEVQRDAEALAWEGLRNTLRPEPASLDVALEALGGPDARMRLAYLEEQLKIIRTVEPARDRIAFTLDPLAEYLAALHLVNKGRADPNVWRNVLAQVAAMPAEREAIKGFLLAVRECCLVRNPPAGVLDLLNQQLARPA